MQQETTKNKPFLVSVRTGGSTSGGCLGGDVAWGRQCRRRRGGGDKGVSEGGGVEDTVINHVVIT